MYGAGEVRVETVPDPGLIEPTDAVVRVTRSAICGSDLWPYNQMEHTDTGRRMGHEFIGVVEDAGAEVRTVKVGDLVVTPFVWSDGTCVFCREGLHTSCLNGGRYGLNGVDGGQGEAVRVPQADGTLVVLPVGPDDELMPSLLTLSDVMATGHYAALSAQAVPGGRWPSSATVQLAVRSDRRTAPRRGADHHPRPPCRSNRAGGRVRGDRRRERARRRSGRACPRAHRRPWRAFGARVRRSRPVDDHGSRDRTSPVAPSGASASRRRTRFRWASRPSSRT